MNVIILCVMCASLMGMTAARPHYIAIPMENIHMLEVAPSPVVRVVRQASFLPVVDTNNQEQEENNRFQRGAHAGGSGGDDYVDFGAHTGHHGAFGWYADFPVHKGH